MYNTSIIHVVQLLLGNYKMNRMIMELICFLFSKRNLFRPGHDSSFDKFNIHEVNQKMNRIEPRDRRAKFADTFCRNDSCDARAPF
jgi:hypothetical protein